MNKIVITLNYDKVSIDNVKRYFTKLQDLEEIKNIIELDGGEVNKLEIIDKDYVLSTGKDISKESLIASHYLIEDAYNKKINLEIEGAGIIATSYSTFFMVSKKGEHKTVSFTLHNEPESKNTFKEGKIQLLRKYIYEKQKEKYNIIEMLNEPTKSANSVSFNTIEFIGDNKTKGNKFIGKFNVLPAQGYKNLVKIEVVTDSYSIMPMDQNTIKIFKDIYYLPKNKVFLVQESSIKLMY